MISSTPRTGERHADVLGAPIQEMPGAAVLMFEPRSMAEKLGRNHVAQRCRAHCSGMAAVLAHEIKNPLAGIRGAAQLIEMQVPEPDRHAAAADRHETDRIAKLVDKMTVVRRGRRCSNARRSIFMTCSITCIAWRHRASRAAFRSSKSMILRCRRCMATGMRWFRCF